MPSKTHLDPLGGHLGSPKVTQIIFISNLASLQTPLGGPQVGLIWCLTAYSYFTPQAGSKNNLDFPVENFTIGVFRLKEKNKDTQFDGLHSMSI